MILFELSLFERNVASSKSSGSRWLIRGVWELPGIISTLSPYSVAVIKSCVLVNRKPVNISYRALPSYAPLAISPLPSLKALVRLPCGSVSMHKTLFPSSPIKYARLDVVTVLPVPPFSIATVIIFAAIVYTSHFEWMGRSPLPLFIQILRKLFQRLAFVLLKTKKC